MLLQIYFCVNILHNRRISSARIPFVDCTFKGRQRARPIPDPSIVDPGFAPKSGHQFSNPATCFLTSTLGLWADCCKNKVPERMPSMPRKCQGMPQRMSRDAKGCQRQHHLRKFCVATGNYNAGDKRRKGFVRFCNAEGDSDKDVGTKKPRGEACRCCLLTR